MNFDWRGLWAVEAEEPDGAGYRGEIDIAPFADGYRLRWAIDGGVGTYFGVGLAAADGLYVACGPQFEGLSLILVDGAAARLLSVEGAAAVSRRVAVAIEKSGWRFDGDAVGEATVRPNGEAHFASLRGADGETREGLAWPTQSGAALASGAPLERLVILFYPVPAGPGGPVEAQWALGRNPRLGAERLSRLR